ncbi:MAG: fibronectin type III-like domain-contianing protein, partial [Alistipes sp.]|nr:fibronectin type III-like domain-contianing protein [Alistipes sp.]
GHGLSYTTYAYDELTLSASQIAADGSLRAEVTVTNTGDRDGVEIVQLYIDDCFSSVTRPVKELRDFARVALRAGESKRIAFEITPAMLSMLDRELRPVVEPGAFRVLVGPSSRDEELLSATFHVR